MATASARARSGSPRAMARRAASTSSGWGNPESANDRASASTEGGRPGSLVSSPTAPQCTSALLDAIAVQGRGYCVGFGGSRFLDAIAVQGRGYCVVFGGSRLLDAIAVQGRGYCVEFVRGRAATGSAGGTARGGRAPGGGARAGS